MVKAAGTWEGVKCNIQRHMIYKMKKKNVLTWMLIDPRLITEHTYIPVIFFKILLQYVCNDIISCISASETLSETRK